MVADECRPDWVRDRERDMYLMQIRGLGPENLYMEWLLYARGKYAAVRIYCVGSKRLEDGTVHRRWRFVGFDNSLYFVGSKKRLEEWTVPNLWRFVRPPKNLYVAVPLPNEDQPAIFRLLEEAVATVDRLRRFVRLHNCLYATIPVPPKEDLPAIFRLLEEALSVYGGRGIRDNGPQRSYRATIEPESEFVEMKTYQTEEEYINYRNHMYANILILIPIVVFAVTAICFGLATILEFIANRDEVYSFFALRGVVCYVFALISRLSIFISPLPCLVLAIVGTVFAAKATKAGNIQSRKFLVIGIVEIIISIVGVFLAVALFIGGMGV